MGTPLPITPTSDGQHHLLGPITLRDIPHLPKEFSDYDRSQLALMLSENKAPGEPAALALMDAGKTVRSVIFGQRRGQAFEAAHFQAFDMGLKTEKRPVDPARPDSRLSLPLKADGSISAAEAQ